MTTSLIEVKPVTPPDVPAISALAREIWQATYPGLITQEQIDFMLELRYGVERLYDDIEQADKWLDQAFYEGRRVGFCAYEIRGSEFYFDKLYIHPDVQRRGVGGAMIAHAADKGRQLGYQRAMLSVDKRNTQAINSYRKYGFDVFESTRSDMGGGLLMDDFVMVKPL